MGLRIHGHGTLINSIERAQKEADNSIERLSTGVRFTREQPIPADKIISDNYGKKIKELNTYKRNAADGMSLTEYADSSLSELSNMNIRMKELVTQATNETISDKQRQYLFVEYESLYNEFERQAITANYNGESLLDHKEGTRNEIDFRVGSPTLVNGKDVNIVRLDNLSEVKARVKDIGLMSAKNLLENEDGISVDDVLDNFDADNESELASGFDQVHEKLAGFRAKFGAVTTRLNHAINSIDVAYENIAASHSRIRDVDYATETTNLTKANILLQAGTSLLSQKQQLEGQSILSLIRGSDKI